VSRELNHKSNGSITSGKKDIPGIMPQSRQSGMYIQDLL